MFLSPRSDLTIRNLTAEQIEAISNAAVDIVGGVVSFSESAIYESEDLSRKEPFFTTVVCPYAEKHGAHDWKFNEWTELHCPGREERLIHG